MKLEEIKIEEIKIEETNFEGNGSYFFTYNDKLVHSRIIKNSDLWSSYGCYINLTKKGIQFGETFSNWQAKFFGEVNFKNIYFLFENGFKLKIL